MRQKGGMSQFHNEDLQRPFYIIVALPDNGRKYQPKHVVNVMKKWMYNRV
jgi:hypothetical protein